MNLVHMTDESWKLFSVISLEFPQANPSYFFRGLSVPTTYTTGFEIVTFSCCGRTYF